MTRKGPRLAAGFLVLVAAGFGTLEVSAKLPARYLLSSRPRLETRGEAGGVATYAATFDGIPDEVLRLSTMAAPNPFPSGSGRWDSGDGAGWSARADARGTTLDPFPPNSRRAWGGASWGSSGLRGERWRRWPWWPGWRDAG